jgi:hypothetical protein
MAEKRKPQYVLCPTCESRSRKLHTMGGVERRECRQGHLFDYDKWMADRLIWAPGATTQLRRPVEAGDVW